MDHKFDYIAFFDLDRTLLRVNSGKVLIHRAHERGIMSKWNMTHAFYLSMLHKFSLMETSRIVRQMPQWLKGKPEEQIIDLCHDVVKNELLDHIRPQMKAEIKKHKEKNAGLVILSAALNYVCDPIAKYLEFDKTICSRLEVIEGVFTGKSNGPLCLKKEKAIRLNLFCKNNTCTKADSYYYGDSLEDLSVLSTVGKPVCISPDRRLLKEAGKRGWTIHNWL